MCHIFCVCLNSLNTVFFVFDFFFLTVFHFDSLLSSFFENVLVILLLVAMEITINILNVQSTLNRYQCSSNSIQNIDPLQLCPPVTFTFLLLL